MTHTLILSDDESALILSPDSIQVHIPDHIMEGAEEIGDNQFALDPDTAALPSMIVCAIASLLDVDDDFVEYLFARMEEVQGDGVRMEIMNEEE